MRKIWLVIKREYMARIRTKGFIITTIAVPLFSVGLLLFTTLVTTREPDHSFKIALIDNAGLAKSIAPGLAEKLKNSQPLFQLVRTLAQPPSLEKAREELADQVRRGLLDGYLVVPKEVLAGKAVEFHTQNAGDYQAVSSIRRALDRAVISDRLNHLGIQVGSMDDLVRPVDFTLVKIRKAGEAVEKGQTFVVAIALSMVLYLTLLVYGVMTMRSVLEEKTTRVVEILVSSARPFELLAGKLLGVAGIGFTQYLIWGGLGALLSIYGAAAAANLGLSKAIQLFHIPASLMVYTIIFFLAGYFLYASLYAAVGAMVPSDDELQLLQLPITLVIVTAFLLFPAVMRDPTSRLSIFVSLIPFLSPILMLFRIALQTPPFWQIALSLALCIGTTVAVVYFAAKIYRVGILMYGKRPSLGELLRWLKYT
jgi:ABC-2 type transport system permease protein